MKLYEMVKKYTALTEKEINWLVETSLVAPSENIVIAGTYHGGDAMAIKLANPMKNIYVIDSFDGLTAPVEEDIVKEGAEMGTMVSGEFSIGGIKRYKQNFKELGLMLPKCYEMFITEESIQQVKIKNIGMLWLDLDHYAPTKVCLDYFNDKLATGAILGCHDYGFVRCPGIKKACDGYSKGWEHATGGIYKLQK